MRSVDPKLHLLKFKMAAAAMLDLDFWPNTVAYTDICVKFGTEIDIGYTRVTVAEYHTFVKIQDGGGRHLGFIFSAISRSQKMFVSKLVCI